MEEREAAILSGYNWKQYLEDFSLTDPEGRWNRAANVAFYRLHHLIQQHVEDAISSDMERRYNNAK